MSEHDVVSSTRKMSSAETLAEDLRALGLKPGQAVLVHSSLSQIGWVSGGAVAVIMALECVLTPSGTLVMPTHSSDLSDPAQWQDPPVPEEWWEIIRETMPPYDRDLTPTRGMGVIPETFRKQPGVLRSDHPAVSFAAWGAHADTITAHHQLDYPFGDGSPLARLYDLDGWVLLLGVGHFNNTSLHLAETRAAWAGKQTVPLGAPMIIDGVRRWVTYQDINIDTSDFTALGDAFNATGQARTGLVGQARSLLFRQRALVDFAIRWLEAHRR